MNKSVKLGCRRCLSFLQYAVEKTKFSNEQIAITLRHAGIGARVAGVRPKMGIIAATFHEWNKKSGGMGVAGVRRLERFEGENRRFKSMVAERLMILLCANASGKWPRPGSGRQCQKSLAFIFGGLCCTCEPTGKRAISRSGRAGLTSGKDISGCIWLSIWCISHLVTEGFRLFLA